MTRFVFLTDTHYWPNAPADYGAPKMLTQGRTIHEAMVSAINALEPDFVLHGGDFLCGGSSFDLPTDVFEESIRDTRGYYDQIQSPFYAVPGNHDCDGQTWSFDSFHAVYDTDFILRLDDIGETLRVGRANVFLGDTKTHGTGQWMDEHDLLLREANSSAKAAGKSIILCLHTWVLPDTQTEPGSHGQGCVVDAKRLLDTISACESVVLVLTGHRHLNRISAYRDFLIADTSCLIGYPFGFREITLTDDGWFKSRFHRLSVPDAMDAYLNRDNAGEDAHWEGQPHDQDSDILIPRLHRSQPR